MGKLQTEIRILQFLWLEIKDGGSTPFFLYMAWFLLVHVPTVHSLVFASARPYSSGLASPHLPLLFGHYSN